MDFRAVKAGDRISLERMISRQETSPSSSDKDGNSLLHIAVEISKNTLSILDLLLSNSWDPNARNNFGAAPLHYVAMRKDNIKEVVQTLVNYGADIEITTLTNHSPLHLACERYKIDFVNDLLERGADPNRLDQNHNTPLHAMLLSNGRDTIAKEIASSLLAKAASPSIKNSDGNNCLLLAGLKGFSKVCQLLLQHGLDCKSINKFGNNIVHQACMGGFAELVEMLLSIQPDFVSSANNDGDTPLHLAVKFNQTDVAVTLIKKGASFTSYNAMGRTPVDLATQEDKNVFAAKHPDLVRVLTIKRKPKSVRESEEIDDACVIQ